MRRKRKAKGPTLTRRLAELERVVALMQPGMKLVEQLPMWGARVGVLEVAVNEHRKRLAAMPAPVEMVEWPVNLKQAVRRIASQRGRRG